MSDYPKRTTYLNTAAVGILSDKSVDAAQKFQEKSKTNPSGTFFDWMNNELPHIKSNLSELAQAGNLLPALTPNFSYSLLAIVHSIRTKIKKVLLFDGDYPSLNMPFELGGFEVHYVKSPDNFAILPEEIDAIIEKEKIELLAISHVQFLTGFTLNIETISEICRRRNVWFILDTTQSLGAVNIHFIQSGIDVMISSSYKWLNGGLGSAVMWIKEDFMEHFPPQTAGFGSMIHSDEGWEYIPSIKSFQPGHLNPVGLIQLGVSTEERLKTGVHHIERHNKNMIEYLAGLLLNLPFKIIGGGNTEQLSAILCIEAEKSVFDRLTEKNIITTWRKGTIRISPHYHNTIQDIDILINALKETLP